MTKILKRLAPVIQEFCDVFNEIGKLRDFSLNLHIDKSVEPLSQPAHRISYAMRDRVAKKLQLLEEGLL